MAARLVVHGYCHATAHRSGRTHSHTAHAGAHCIDVHKRTTHAPTNLCPATLFDPPTPRVASSASPQTAYTNKNSDTVTEFGGQYVCAADSPARRSWIIFTAGCYWSTSIDVTLKVSPVKAGDKPLMSRLTLF